MADDSGGSSSTEPDWGHPHDALDQTTVLSAQPAQPAADDSAGSVARNSGIMALGSIVSRLTGFVRTAAIGAAIGAGFVGDDYTLANTLPNMVYELLLGGVLSSVIIPVLVRTRRTEPDKGEAYAQRLLTLAVIFFGAATVVAVASAPVLTALMSSSSTTGADRNLITTMAYLLLPEIFFYGMAALVAAILNVRGHFAAPMWTPILNNIVVILTAGAFMLLPSSLADVTPESISAVQIAVLGVGTTLGIVVQALGLLPALRKTGFRWRWRTDFSALGLAELGRLASWMLVYVAFSQLGVMLVLRIAKKAGDSSQAGPLIYNYAFLIFMMAHGIVAVSIMTALMPRLSAAADAGRMEDLANQLSLGTRLSAVILVPAAAIYVALGGPLAVTLFQWGSYTHAQAVATGPVLAVAGLALVPYAISQLQIFAFYALSDTKRPALINIPVVLFRLVLAFSALYLLPASSLAAGLMGASTLSFVGCAVLGYWLLRRRVGPLDLGRIGSTLLRLTAAAAAGGVAAVLLRILLASVLGDDKIASIVQLAGGCLVLVVGYVAVARLLHVPEMREVTDMVSRRLRRR